MEHAIVVAARGWLGTRFHHQGRLKKSAAHKGGVDCLGLLVGIAVELGLRDSKGNALVLYDETSYPHNPDSKHLAKRLSELLQRIPREQMDSGDILLLDIQGSPQHLAVASIEKGEYRIIHAYAPARAVVEHELDTWWQSRVVCVFRIP
jgi:hypothetical protein